MKVRRTLRIISFVMLIVAVVFVFCALSTPALGKVIYVGTFEFGPDLWRVCYAVYAFVMIALFGISFFVKENK